MGGNFQNAFDALAAYCRREDYSGYDPFDGLNSMIFKALPFKISKTFRLAFLQAFKRNPLNLRKTALIEKGLNPKGIALFALGWMECYRKNPEAETKGEVSRLLGMLESLRAASFSGGAAWGYNFDWQGRAFFAPKGTPTIVPTAFAARAFFEANELFGESRFSGNTEAACNFVVSGLRKTHESDGELCFSYSPNDSTRVYNANLLAAEVLASGFYLSKNERYREMAVAAARYVVNRQAGDGSWAYGDEGYQAWADNFHTAFNLSSLKRISGYCTSGEFEDSIQRGYSYWITNFFEADGAPKYYHNRLYPIDCHSSGAAIATLCEFGNIELAAKVAEWSIANMQDPSGYFYYQKKRFFTNRIPYMRWTQSWMFYGLAKLLSSIE